MLIGYRPITEEGRLLISVGSGVCLLAGVIALLTEGHSPWTELAFCAAIPTVIAISAIAFFKMDQDF